MAIVKNLNADYLIDANGNDITLDSSDVYVVGNLVVQGNTTTISTTNTDIEDNFIRLNIGETGAGVTQRPGDPAAVAGIGVDRGSLDPVSLIWNEDLDKWQITDDGTTFANILISSTGTISLVDDPAPTLGANLNTQTYHIFSNSNNVIFNSNIQLNEVATAPSLVSGATVVYAATPGAGTSGVYVVNGSAANQELVTKARAFGFSLIL
jgi:hypothetical protein